MTTDQVSVTAMILVDGQDLAPAVSDLVTRVVVEDELSLPDLALVYIEDPSGDALGRVGATIGSSLEIRVRTGTEPAGRPIFVGEVTGIEVEIENERRILVLRGYDKSHRLQRGRITETHEDATIGDVLGKVARRHDLTPVDRSSTSWVNEQIIQWNESDWEFLYRLASDYGQELVVDGQDNLELRTPVEASSGPGEGTRNLVEPCQLVAGENLIRIRAGLTAGDAATTVEVRGWDPKTKTAVVGTASVGEVPTHATDADVGSIASDFGTTTLVRSDLPLSRSEPATAAAEGIAGQLGASVAEIEGVTFGDPQLRAGAIVNVTGVDRSLDGQHTLTSCRHVLGPQLAYTTEFRSAGTQRRGLLGLVSGSAPSHHGVEGVVPAIVTDLDDPEQLGRVRVNFPWLGDAAVSPWARVLSVGGGAGRGLVMLPEIDDEVLVGFQHGNTQQPFVLGGLHNGVDELPDGPSLTDGQLVNKRTMVSRTNQRLAFSDADGERGVLLSVGDDSLQIDMQADDTKIVVRSNGDIEISSGRDVSIDAGGGLSLSAGGQVEISGVGVKIDAGGGALEANGTSAKVQASGALELTGASAKLAGSASTEITGAVVRIN